MKQEARLLQYSLLYNRSGKLITERISTDIKKLKPYLTTEEYATLQTIVREGTIKLDEIHNYIEANLNARIMTD
jgi:ribonucleotide reductase beta subunit family protein with ferritin-like domain